MVYYLDLCELYIAILMRVQKIARIQFQNIHKTAIQPCIIV